MYYIQRQDIQTKQLETVDEFTTRKEARAMLYEYSLSDLYAGYYISTRSCEAWRNINNSLIRNGKKNNGFTTIY